MLSKQIQELEKEISEMEELFKNSEREEQSNYFDILNQLAIKLNKLHEKQLDLQLQGYCL